MNTIHDINEVFQMSVVSFNKELVFIYTNIYQPTEIFPYLYFPTFVEPLMLKYKDQYSEL